MEQERGAGARDSVATNPLRFCEQLYAVVVGLGLALSANHVVQFSQRGVPVDAKHIPLFVAYLAFAFRSPTQQFAIWTWRTSSNASARSLAFAA